MCKQNKYYTYYNILNYLTWQEFSKRGKWKWGGGGDELAKDKLSRSKENRVEPWTGGNGRRHGKVGS